MEIADKVMKSGVAKALGALMFVAVVASLLLVGADALSVRVEYDEAYNLQVAESLRQGHGYSTFGALGSGQPWKFDPHITTGPVVLLPAAAVWSLTDGSVTAVRTLMLVFLWAYAAGWWLLLRQCRAGWFITGVVLAPALAAATVAAGRVLGEVPGAALLVWAGVALARRKPALAALAIGLAVQTKLVYGLAGALMLAVWLLVAIASDDRPRPRLFVAVVFLAAAPSLLFELYRLVSLGALETYLASIGEFREFLAAQRISTTTTWVDAATLGAKMSGLFGIYPTHAWVALSAGAVALICRPALLDGSSGPVTDAASRLAPPTSSAFTALLAAGIAMALGWITQSQQTGVRQALPFFLLGVPTLVALCSLRSVQFLRESSALGQRFLVPRIAVAGAAILLTFSMLAALGNSLRQTVHDEPLRASALEQKQVVAMVRSLRPESLYAKGFWHNPEYLLLSGVKGAPRRTFRQLLIVQDYQVALSNTSWADHESMCGDVVRKTQFTLICWLPDAPTKVTEFRIRTWGPKWSMVGTVPLPQADGGAGFWLRIAPVIPEDVGPIRIHVGPHASEATLSLPNADLLSVVVPGSLFMQPGLHELVVEQISTGRRTAVGILRVFKISDWGPKSSPVGTVPSPQAGGEAGFWFRIAPGLPEDIGPIRIHVGPHASEASVQLPNADLVSATVPAALFMQPGSHEVVFEQISTGERTVVGTLRVE